MAGAAPIRSGVALNEWLDRLRENMQPKYPITGSHTNEYLVLHALENGECSVRNMRHCISEDTKPVRRWTCLTGAQVTATLQRLKCKGLAEQKPGTVNLWQLRSN